MILSIAFFIPVCVAIRQGVGDQFSRKQEESPEQVNDAERGDKEEGGQERDARLV